MSLFKKKSGETINIKDIECITINKNEILVLEVDDKFNSHHAYDVKLYLQEISKKIKIDINVIFKTPNVKKIYKIRKNKK